MFADCPLQPGQAQLPAAPGQPTGSTTDRTATITWPSVPGVVKYEVHRQLGTISEQWGETSGTSFTAGNLNPGTRYTVNVLARNAAGAVSWSSPPLTVTTASPAESSCTVRLSNVTDWSSGFVGAVDITSTQAMSNWTLNFDWPTTRQQVSSGWNATWTQTGSAVTVVGSTRIEPNGTVNAGFVGNYTGPNITPTAFRLNGTLCHTTS